MIEQKRIILNAMRLLVAAAEEADGDGLRLLFRAYNRLRVRLDGTPVPLPKPRLPKYDFQYNKTLQMIVLNATM